MIVDGILSVVFDVADFFFSILPDIEINASSGMYQTFLDIVASVAYLFPLNTLLSIFGIVCALIFFKFIITMIRMVWDILPIA